MPNPTPLDPALLRRACDPSSVPFDTTDGAAAPDEPLGQDRAVEALRLAAGLGSPGHHVYAMGPPETGKLTLVLSVLGREAARAPTPRDVCYVNDFARPHRPRALLLPPGRGEALRADLDRLVDDLRTEVPAALEGEELRTRREAVEDEVKERSERGFDEVRAAAESKGIALLRTPLGFGLAPARDGEVMTPEQVAALGADERRRLESDVADLQRLLADAIARTREMARDAREKLKALTREVLGRAIDHLIGAAKARHADIPEIVAHLEAIRSDVVENVGDFLHPREQGPPPTLAGAERAALPGAPFRRYLANVLVDRSGQRGASVLFEPHPTVPNLLGRVEHESHLGTLVTDFHLVRAGALHRANGGYLVLDARELLVQPYAWDALKRTLRSREIRIESLGQSMGFITTVSLEPEPIPLDVKVVLVGDRWLLHLLDAYDPEFRALFKIVADFADRVDRTAENERLYARLVASVARGNGLRPLDRGAVAAVVEWAARASDDGGRISTHVGPLADLLRESDHRAAGAGRATATADDVRGAVRDADRRTGRVRDLVLEQFRDGAVLLEVDGARVGQVNALSVIDLGRAAFGRPSRVTARVRLGKGEVVDVERAVELSGPIHSKGVMILSAFLAARYAPDHPLSLAATLVFEQSYGPVDGDSASCAELCALLSALAEAPLAQHLAITGSVDQRGQVQPIGGVNEKIEGFFDACAAFDAARGAAGGAGPVRGVVIPATNVRHLMLREDVVAAAREGRFRVIAVRDADEAIEALTGLPAGARGPDGAFPDGSVNARVEARLVALARRRAELGRETRAEGP